MKKRMLLMVLVFFTAGVVIGQSEKAAIEEREEGIKGAHQFVLVLGHTHLGTGIKDNGKPGWKAVPSTGFDYHYWVSNKWAIGVQNDLVIESFEVEEHDEEVIKRTTPFSSVAAAIFKPGKHMSYLAGIGGEFAHEENFALTRIGLESGWEMKNDWEFSVSLVFDIKWNGYDSWGFGFGISKFLKKKKH